ncbi:MAG: amidohydrolase, partial [Myxococcota bacterium]|nr:amidohydrolase [Myxococcota bacterium]
MRRRPAPSPRPRPGLLAALGLALLAAPAPAAGDTADPAALRARADVRARAATPRVVAWRRDIHAHPE